MILIYKEVEMKLLMKKIQSTCNLCALACNIDFHVEDGKIYKVSPTVDYPVNKGFCCIKGLNLDKQQTKIKARKTPLLRDENGEMKEISWEEGIKTFAKKMTEIQEKCCFHKYWSDANRRYGTTWTCR